MRETMQIYANEALRATNDISAPKVCRLDLESFGLVESRG